MRATAVAGGPRASPTPEGPPDPVTVDQLVTALARAATPDERLHGGWLRPAGDPDLARGRHDRWVSAAADGRQERVDALLAELGCSADAWRSALADVVVVPGAPLPGWLRDARELLDLVPISDPGPAPALREVAGEGLPSWVDGDQPWRFHPGFAGWLAAAETDVADWTRQASLAETARRDLVLDLARRQLAGCGPLLMTVAAARPSDEPLFGGDPRGDWAALWRSHPVVGRLLALVRRQWRTTTAELVARIRSDLADLHPATAVLRIDQSAGDQHDQGRGVARLRLSDGTSLFLKPRSDGLHRVLATVLDRVDGAGGPLGLRLPIVHDRDRYAFVEEVAAADCADEAAVAGYFRRAGALLRVLQALGATDLHHENFVPAADGPVLIDLETAVAPGPLRPTRAGRDQAPDPALAARLADTPGPTSMVTSVVTGPPGRAAVDIGALAGPVTALTPYAVRSLVPGPDGPAVSSRRTPLANGAALPTRGGRPQALRGHEQDLLEGFAEVQRRLVSLPAEELLASTGPTPAVRFVPRPTRTYARLLQQSLAPDALTDGVERELVLHRLHRADDAPAGLVACEIEALRELDIPLFTVPFDSEDLVSERGVVLAAALSQSPADRTRARLVAVGARNDHLDDLRATVFSLAPTAEPARFGPRPRDDESAVGDDADLAGEPLRLLLDRTLALRDGSVTWVGLEHDPNRNRWTHGRVGPGLSGQAGLGLALAAVCGTSQAPAGTAAAARAALIGAVDRVGDGRTGASDAFGGPAGVLYATATGAGLLGDPDLGQAAESLIEPCLRAARRGEPSVVVDAVAGGVLALLRLPATPVRTDALAELLTLLQAPAPAGVLDPPDSWARSLPSAAAGRRLARHRWAGRHTPGTAASLGHQEAADPTDLSAAPPGDVIAAAAVRPPAVPGPLAPTTALIRLLDAAALVDAGRQAAHRSGGDLEPWSTARALLSRTVLERRARTGRWCGPALAPDHTLLSPLHGLAALCLLCADPGPTVPIARVLS